MSSSLTYCHAFLLNQSAFCPESHAFLSPSKLKSPRILSPEFAKYHLNLRIHDRPQSTIFNYGHHIYFLNLDTRTCTSIIRDEDITSSCNGLLLLSRRDGRVLLNPITRESHKIPTCACAATFCLGYDSLNDDYKIVSLGTHDCYDSLYDDYKIVSLGTDDCLVGVYSVRTRTWRAVSGCPYNLGPQGSGVFLNGCIHWLVTDTDFMIASFSLGSEEFGKLPLPRLDCPDSLVRFRSAKLKVLGGCLSLVLDVQDKSIDVWMMKEYGVQDSWTKLTINHSWTTSKSRDDILGHIRVLDLVCLFGNDEVLGMKDDCQFFAYSFSNRVWRDVGVRSFSGSHFTNLTSFSESLVSPRMKSVPFL